MLLSRRILIGNLLLLAGLLALGTAPVWGLFRVMDKVQIGVDEYTELRLLQKAALHVAMAENVMIGSASDLSELDGELDAASQVLREYIGFQHEVVEGPESHEIMEQDLGTQALSAIDAVREAYSSPEATIPEDRQREHLRMLGGVLEKLNRLAVEADHLVATTHQGAVRNVRNTIIALAALGIVVIVIGLVIGVQQYNHVMRPLGALRQGVRTVASGGLSTRVPETGDTEFLELAADFNQMAQELQGLYRGLEEKVEIKSRELVQSERLASVGFLAAGVAHEINNPLNIISGYAELSLRKLRRSTDSDRIEDALQTLQIIRDEAFRCKGITEKLLSLSTPADNTREPLSLRPVVEDVFAMLRYMNRFRERNLQLENGSTVNPIVLANENEIKQVLLNLMVNALEATDNHGGRVWVDLEQDEQWVRLAVNDNGQGMTPDVCQHVFEPFFSAKRSNGCRGIGLGLSISHAIVANHSGRLLAQSQGPGRGSRFTIELPAYGGPSA